MRSAAIIEPGPAALDRIRDAAARIRDWEPVIANAESHGLANLLRTHLERCDIELPQDCRQQLTALKVRHLRANRARMAALAEILQAFQRPGIDCAVLKGAALVNLIYPSPDMRPMGDIDILVPAPRAGDARDALRAIGFVAGEKNRGALAGHHHLPVASRRDNGVDILVEVHVDALSRDSGNSLDWSAVQPDLQRFEVEGVIGHAPGHRHMLLHLCRHTLEPVERIKLVALADIYGYCAHFDGAIPWQQIAHENTFVINMLTMLGYLAAPPGSLANRLKPLPDQPPAGVGLGYPPLSASLASRQPLAVKLGNLVSAPDWWLHCFYNVPPDGSLRITKLLHHPVRVLRWILRRYRSGLIDRFSR